MSTDRAVLTPGALLVRLDRKLRRYSALSGMALGLARFFNVSGIVLLVLWSYSLWGSETTPLRHLLVPAIIFLAINLLIRLVFIWSLRWIHRVTRVQRRRRLVQQQVRLSAEEVKKPEV